MDVRFPDLPLYRGFGAPQRLACDVRDVIFPRRGTWAPAEALSTGRYRP